MEAEPRILYQHNSPRLCNYSVKHSATILISYDLGGLLPKGKSVCEHKHNLGTGVYNPFMLISSANIGAARRIGYPELENVRYSMLKFDCREATLQLNEPVYETSWFL